MSDTAETPDSPEQLRCAATGREHNVIGYLLQTLEVIAAGTADVDSRAYAQFHLDSLDRMGWTVKRDAQR
jgi:hypothetical protein